MIILLITLFQLINHSSRNYYFWIISKPYLQLTSLRAADREKAALETTEKTSVTVNSIITESVDQKFKILEQTDIIERTDKRVRMDLFICQCIFHMFILLFNFLYSYSFYYYYLFSFIFLFSDLLIHTYFYLSV